MGTNIAVKCTTKSQAQMALGMVFEKRSPRLRGAMARHGARRLVPVASNRTRRMVHAELSELERKLIFAELGMLAADADNQVDVLLRNRRPSPARAPAPQALEAQPIPSKDGGGLEDDQRLTPAGEDPGEMTSWLPAEAWQFISQF